ncbi:hypothetical protein SAMN05428995_1073 [Loktanella sp. DSM 29012]|nr:hypothetical protein SAMN05428995_1073 [Loktanella sp. DSM 29012]
MPYDLPSSFSYGISGAFDLRMSSQGFDGFGLGENFNNGSFKTLHATDKFLADIAGYDE